MGNTRFTFRKEERLCSKKLFDKLFAEGSAFLVYPLRVVFIKTDFSGEYPVKAAFTVSKKLFKRAVRRNLIKRRIREAYRLNKHVLYATPNNEKMALCFIYVGKEMIDYPFIEEAMKKALHKLIRQIQNEIKPGNPG